jgi:plastocyanin
LVAILAAAAGNALYAGYVGFGGGVEGHMRSAFSGGGDSRKAARSIEITIQEGDNGMAFVPAEIEVRQGDQIKFVLKSGSEHEPRCDTVRPVRRS